MHEDLANADKSLSSYLFSSPFGSSGHGHASQNAFTINYKGKVIFGGTGYYSNFSDKHNLLHYRSTKAYNTILADSLNQKIGEEGYGWIPRAISGKRIQYALGDASNAYGEIKSEFWLNRFEQIKVVPSKENGYGESGVTLYRRHMLQLEGGYIVLYDELEAKNPVKWTTQFHCPYYTIEGQNAEKSNQQQFVVKTDLGNVTANVYAESPLKMAVHNQFFEAAVNWNKVTDDEGKIKDFKNQWHAGITSEPKQKFRFLTIIQIKEGKTEVIKTLSNVNELKHLQVGDWEILAQLDGKKTAALQVIGKSAKSAFSFGNQSLEFEGKKYAPKIAGSSVLLEIYNSKVNKQEVVDELPDAAKYDKN
ncbi:heparinase II/III family protein [Flavobacterium sp. YO12]|uniref:heparinase II/III domain-containing protein n=1 Tax=Flavobacterium sp. YO12 TaxID=1920029 RepID=UPI001F508C3F|nr:heparinase II/III family protein [Flavobacterium sp. YO12]